MPLRAREMACVTLEWREDLQITFLAELRSALGGGAQQCGAHGGEDAVVAGGVIAQGLVQLHRHERGVASGGN